MLPCLPRQTSYTDNISAQLRALAGRGNSLQRAKLITTIRTHDRQPGPYPMLSKTRSTKPKRTCHLNAPQLGLQDGQQGLLSSLLQTTSGALSGTSIDPTAATVTATVTLIVSAMAALAVTGRGLSFRLAVSFSSRARRKPRLSS